MTQSVRSKAS